MVMTPHLYKARIGLAGEPWVLCLVEVGFNQKSFSRWVVPAGSLTRGGWENTSAQCGSPAVSVYGKGTRREPFQVERAEYRGRILSPPTPLYLQTGLPGCHKER